VNGIFMFLLSSSIPVRLHGKRQMMRKICLVLLLFSSLLPFPTVLGTTTGSITMQSQDYGTFQGQLQNATILSNGTVTMLMIVNDQIQTPIGTFPVQATAKLYGIQNANSVSGVFQDFTGSVGDAKFTGQANWAGTLTSSTNGGGAFSGTIIVTSSPYPQLPAGRSYPISGSWASSFASPVPEFQGTNILLLAFLLLTITSLALRKTRER
jgi:hypothetical protein